MLLLLVAVTLRAQGKSPAQYQELELELNGIGFLAWQTLPVPQKEHQEAEVRAGCMR